MYWITVTLALILVLHIVLNIHVGRRVMASSFYEAHQKKIQIAFLWLLPLFGIILVWIFLCPERPKREAEPECPDDDLAENLEDVGSAAKEASHTLAAIDGD